MFLNSYFGYKLLIKILPYTQTMHVHIIIRIKSCRPKLSSDARTSYYTCIELYMTK